MPKILYINPVGSEVFNKSVLETIKMVKRSDVKARVVHLARATSLFPGWQESWEK